MAKNNKHRPPQKPKNVKSTISRIFKYMEHHKARLFVVIIAIVISSLTQVIATSFLGTIIDEFLTPLINKYSPELMAGFWRMVALMCCVYLVGAVSSYLYQRLMLIISTDTLFRIRTDMFKKMETLPIKFFDTNTHGELMSRYTNDTDTLREMLSNSISAVISSVITVIGAFSMMVYYSWQLTVVVLLTLVVVFNVIKFIGSKSSKFFKQKQKTLGETNGYIEEMIEGAKVVKVFCFEKESNKEFETLSEKLRVADTNAHTYANILMPIMGNIAHINYAVLAIVGGIIAIKFPSVLSLGAFVAFLEYSRNFTRPITQVSQQFQTVLSALAGAERIFDLIDQPSEIDNGYVTLVNAKRVNGELVECEQRTGCWAWKHPHKDGTLTYTELKGDVVFENVTFAYEKDHIVLNDISLYARPGEKISFVGSTGAGKTTITNLINRFYDVPDGKIRYDGININKIKKADLRRSLAMVLQDTHLFTGTVMDNIRYGRLDATDEECIEAARLSNAHFFISHLPDGYNTVITADGASLSQGQRQLLAIARAAVADPPVLILDEATSSIDTRTEALIEKGMDKLMQGRTVFVIAHRLSTVRNSNAIMVLEKGEIIERGDHNALIEQKGKYYELYTGTAKLE